MGLSGLTSSFVSSARESMILERLLREKRHSVPCSVKSILVGKMDSGVDILRARVIKWTSFLPLLYTLWQLFCEFRPSEPVPLVKVH